jgi:hypothetical protein
MPTWLRMVLVTASVGGGFTGFVVTLTGLGTPLPASSRVILVAFAALYVFVVVAGLLFVHNPRRLVPLAVALGMQVPFVASPGVAYRFSAGAHVTVGVMIGQPSGSVRLMGSGQLGSSFLFVMFQPRPLAAGINLVALALFAGVLWARSRRLLPVGEGLAKLAGAAKGLPPDLAARHDQR